MKKIFFILLLVYSTLLFSQESSLLWEIKGNGLKNTSYLYGTLHSKDSRAHEFGDSVMVKLSKSDMVVVENIDTDKTSKKKALGMVMMKDTKLEDLLGHEDYLFVKNNATDKMGVMGILLNTMKPVFTLTIIGLTSSVQEMPYTVDALIKSEARQQKKKLIGLETAEEALQSLDGISLKEQSKMLLDFFKDYDKNVMLTDSMIKIYQAQDLNKLYLFYENEKKVPLSFDKHLVVKRNNKFTESLIPLIKKQSVFCAVGALHLPGETGLINALRKKGYEVTPVFNKYIPGSFYIEDKREWYNYVNDSLYLSMSFPNDPYYETKTLSGTDGDINTIKYHMLDSLHQLNYTVTIMAIPPTLSTNTTASIQDVMVAQLCKTKGWKKIKESNVEYQELAARDVEFNISPGNNIRLKIVAKGGNIYLIAVSGFKNKLYSNISETFFEGIYLSNCTVEVQLQIEDDDTHELLKDFQIAIFSNSIDTVLLPDTIGQIAFTLPSKENEYMITVASKNYVSKKIVINTAEINKTGHKTVILPGTTSMIKSKQGVDYSIFNTPNARARLINDSTFAWDIEYISKMKEEINKQFPAQKKAGK